MISEDILKAVIPKDLLQNVVENSEYNKTISYYYEKFKSEAGVVFSRPDIEKKKKRLDFCNKFWLMDKYEMQKIKDFQKTNLCSDKFCSNCKKVKQASRMSRYIPEIDHYKENLYHLTLTLPNCEGTQLKYTYDKMAKAFKSLIRIITGNYRVSTLDFQSWGYLGAVRSLEVTFNGKNYHPHFHVGIILTKQLGRKIIENKYSFDFKKGIAELKRLFCEEEILIQKMWYLLLNDIKITKENIDKLELGYSCAMDKFNESDYAELFKYMTKETDQTGNVLTYDNFVTLLHGLYGVHQIRGYGCLHRIKDEDNFEDYERIYDEMIQKIRAKENPSAVTERPRDLLSDSEYTLISRKTYFKYLANIITDQDT